MIINYIITGLLALIMLGVGMSIQFSDFRAIVKRPYNFFLGLLAQIALLPLIAFVIAWVLPIAPAFKVGLVVLSLCPGGNTSNYISYLTKANTALSISLTTVNSFVALLTIPLLSNMALAYFYTAQVDIVLPFWKTIFQILIVSIIPVSIGIALNQRWPLLAKRIERPTKVITLVMLFVAFSLLLFSKPEDGGVELTMEDIQLLLPITLLLHIIGLLLGFYLPKIKRTSLRNRLTLSIEVGLQNTSLSLLVTGALIGISEMSKPALVYAMYTFFTTLGWAWFHRYGGTIPIKEQNNANLPK